MDANNQPQFYRQLGKEPQELITAALNHYTRASSHLDPRQSSLFHRTVLGEIARAARNRRAHLGLDYWGQKLHG